MSNEEATAMSTDSETTPQTGQSNILNGKPLLWKELPSFYAKKGYGIDYDEWVDKDSWEVNEALRLWKCGTGMMGRRDWLSEWESTGQWRPPKRFENAEAQAEHEMLYKLVEQVGRAIKAGRFPVSREDVSRQDEPPRFWTRPLDFTLWLVVNDFPIPRPFSTILNRARCDECSQPWTSASRWHWADDRLLCDRCADAKEATEAGGSTPGQYLGVKELAMKLVSRITISEGAAMTRVSRACTGGKLPSTNKGKARRIREGDALAWLESQKEARSRDDHDDYDPLRVQ